MNSSKERMTKQLSPDSTSFVHVEEMGWSLRDSTVCFSEGIVSPLRIVDGLSALSVLSSAQEHSTQTSKIRQNIYHMLN